VRLCYQWVSASHDPTALRRLDEIGEADVLVGIPCFENEATIGGVVTAIEAGLRKYFPDLRAVICVSDGGSSDRTREVALRAGVGDRADELLVPRDSPVPERLVFEYRGPPGKGSAIRSIVEAAGRLGVRACALIDADLRSITPAWLDRLLGPIVHHGFGFVTPVYARHKHDGTITNSLAYPVTTALYGARIRQPIGGEFGLSGDLAGHLAAQDVWDTDVARFGIDIWMTTTAVVEGYRICQAILGAKLHDPKDPGKDLGPMFRQVVGSLFALAGRHHDRWVEIETVETPPTFGFRAVFSAEPVAASIRRLTRGFVDGHARHHELWRRVLSDGAMAELERVVEQASETGAGIALEDERWFTIVYDYLVAYNAREIEAGPLLDSLIPLYFARTATFVERTRDDSPEEAEARIEAAVDVAVERKPYLVERWAALKVPARPLRDQPVP
jgi:glycosyltransferase involved in cell wall biosynthesis